MCTFLWPLRKAELYYRSKGTLCYVHSIKMQNRVYFYIGRREYRARISICTSNPDLGILLELQSTQAKKSYFISLSSKSVTCIKVSYFQNEFRKSLFVPKYTQKVVRMSALWKGQFISKWFWGLSISSKKRTKTSQPEVS